MLNRGAQNVASVVARWCLWRVQRGPSGPVEYCVICSWPLHFGFIVFLQRNPAIKLLCNDVDVVLVYLVDSVVLVCCCDKYRIVLCTILPIQCVFLVLDNFSCFLADRTNLTYTPPPAHHFVFLDFATCRSIFNNTSLQLSCWFSFVR